MSKAQNDKRLSIEKKLVAAIRDKMDAITNAQFFKNKQDSAKNRNRGGYTRLSSAERRKLRRRKIEGLRNEIHLLLYANGLRPHFHDPQIPQASQAESLAIRFDFDGIMHRPDSSQLSSPYQNAKQAYLSALENAEELIPLQYPPQDYNLLESPIWKKMKLFENFRQTRKKIISSLVQNHIPPAVVKTMNYYDFVDALIDHCKRTKTRPFEGSRSKNLKMFAACYGEDFFQVMISLRYKPESIKEMLQQMHRGQSPNILDFHHKTNVTNFKEMSQPEEINKFSNMLLTFIHPHHRSLHFGKGYDIDRNVVFFGGYDPAYQIRRDPEKERLYFLQNTGNRNHGTSR